MEREFRHLMDGLEAGGGDAAPLTETVDRALTAANGSADAAWRRFLFAHAHRFTRGGGAMLLQIALAQPPASELHAAGRAWLETHPVRWLERIDRARPSSPGACLRTLEGHAAGVCALSVDAGQRLIFSGAADGSVRVWDLGTGVALKAWQTDGHFIAGIALHPDGNRVLIGASPYLELWDLARGQRLKQLASGLARLEWMLLHPDGERVVVAGERRAMVRELESGRLLVDRELPDGLHGLALHVDGGHVLTTSGFRTLEMWRLDDGSVDDRPTEPGYSRARAEMEQAAAAQRVIYLPDGARAVSYGTDRRLSVWQLPHRQVQYALDGHTATVRAAVITPDGARLISGADDGTVRMWDLAAEPLPADASAHQEPVSHAAVTSDGERAITVCGAGLLKAWDLDAGVCITTQLPFWRMSAEHRLTAAALFPDGETALLADNRGTIKRVEMLTSKNRWRATAEGAAFHALDVDPTGRTAVSADGAALRVWAAQSGVCVTTVRPPARVQFGALAVLDGERAAVAAGSDVVLYDLVTGDRLAVLAAGEAPVTALASGPDDTLLAGHADGLVRLWTLSDARVIRLLQGHTAAVTAIAVHPDARHAATLSIDRSARLWTLPAGLPFARWDCDALPTACALSASNRLVLADATGAVHLFQLH